MTWKSVEDCTDDPEEEVLVQMDEEIFLWNERRFWSRKVKLVGNLMLGWHGIDFLAVASSPFKYIWGFSKEVSLVSPESMELLVVADLNLLNADAFEINSGIKGFNSSAWLTLKTDSWSNRFRFELGWPLIDMVEDLFTVGAAMVLGASFLSCSADRPKPGICSKVDWVVVVGDSLMLGGTFGLDTSFLICSKEHKCSWPEVEEDPCMLGAAVILGARFLSCSEDRPKPGICSEAYKVDWPVIVEDPYMLGGTFTVLGVICLSCSEDRPKPEICSEAYKGGWPVVVEDPVMLGGTLGLRTSFLACSEDGPILGICSEEHRGGCLKLRKEFINGLWKIPRNGKGSCGIWGYKLGIMDVPVGWIDEHNEREAGSDDVVVDRWQGGDPELRKKSKTYISNFFNVLQRCKLVPKNMIWSLIAL